MNINRKWLFGIATLVVIIASIIISKPQSGDVSNIHLESLSSDLSETELKKKIGKLERYLNALSKKLNSVQDANEKLVKQLDQFVTKEELEAFAEGSDSDLYQSRSAAVDLAELQEVAHALQSDKDAAMIYESYLKDLSLEKERETIEFFRSLPQDPELQEGATSFINEQFASKFTSGILDQIECRQAICKVDISIDIEDSDNSTMQETEIVMQFADKFPQTRLSHSVENGRLRYKGYLSKTGVTLPDENSFFSDGKITSDEIAEIKAMLNL